METSAPSPREQGIAALREGDLDRAIDCLGRAVALDDRDAEARACLGVAYSRKGLHAQAKQLLQAAVELQPQNARYRFNLGAALETAGDAPGAALAYREALRIDPEHAQAKARLHALGPPAQAPFAGSPPPAAARVAGPAAVGDPRPAAGSPPPGSIACPRCGEWQRPGVSCEFCGTPLRSPSAAPSGASSYGARAPFPGSPIETVYAAAAPEMSAIEAFVRRFLAVLLDGLLLAILGAGLIFGGRVDLPQWAFLLIYTLYSAGMLTFGGQTLGKRALGVRVIGPDGSPPGFLRAVLRESIGKYISEFVFCLGYLWMLWDDDQQTWHDKIAGTTVERA